MATWRPQWPPTVRTKNEKQTEKLAMLSLLSQIEVQVLFLQTGCLQTVMTIASYVLFNSARKRLCPSLSEERPNQKVRQYIIITMYYLTMWFKVLLKSHLMIFFAKVSFWKSFIEKIIDLSDVNQIDRRVLLTLLSQIGQEVLFLPMMTIGSHVLFKSAKKCLST